MYSFEVAVAWIVISPLAFLTNCLGVVFILHYQPMYHSCDVAFISLFITMATNALLLLPIPAVVKLGDFYWSKDLCACYTWLSITLRSSHFLVLLILNVYWMASLRLSNKKHLFTSATPMKLSVGICWFIAVIAGLIPTADSVQILNFYSDNTCKFLPMSVNLGFGVYFIILSLLSSIMGVISSLDTLLIFRSMRDVALSKYNADRFHVPTISGSLRPGSLIHAKYNELNVSLELCRLVLWFSICSSVISGIPLMASQFVQLVQEYNRETMEITLLWLLLIESLTLPHLLWALSRRYRHAVVYTWRVFVLRDGSYREEDTSACTLQNFRTTVKGGTYRNNMNGNITLQANGNLHGHAIEDVSTDVITDVDGSTSMPRANGHVRAGHADKRINGARGSGEVLTDIEDGLTVVTHVASPGVVVMRENSPEGVICSPNKTQSRHNNTQETSFALQTHREIEIYQVSQFSTGTALSRSERDTSSRLSPTSAYPGTPNSMTSHLKVEDVRRSRQEWKDLMRKKHLPGDFLDHSLKYDQDTLLVDSSISQKDRVTSEATTERGIPSSNQGYQIIINKSVEHRQLAHKRTFDDHQKRAESPYYMSADYDYDFVNNTLIRPHPHTPIQMKTMYRHYNDEDIVNVLDGSFAGDGSVTGAITQETSKIDLLPPLAKYRQPIFDEHAQRSEEVTDPLRSVINSSLSNQYHTDNNYDEKFQHKLSYFDKNGVVVNKSDSEDLQRNVVALPSVPGGNRSKNLPQPEPSVVPVSFGYPMFLRSNYRKFLPYTDLVISNVDDVPGDDSMGYTEGSDQEKRDESKSKPAGVTKSSLYVVSVQNEPDSSRPVKAEIRNDTASNMLTATSLHKDRASNQSSSALLLKNSASNISTTTSLNKVSATNQSSSMLLPKQPTSNALITTSVLPNDPQDVSKDPSRETTDATADLPSGEYPQDYSKLENISGSEMLRLKMRSLRSASAVYHGDDTTSDEGGLVNNGFDDNSEDDSEDCKHKSESVVVGGNINGQKLPDVKLRSLGSGRSSPSPSTVGLRIEKSAEYTPERNYSGDGEESDLNSPIHDNSSLAGFINYSFDDGPENSQTSQTSAITNHNTKYTDSLTPTKIHNTAYPVERLAQSANQNTHISSTEHPPTNSSIFLSKRSSNVTTNASSVNYLSSSFPSYQEPQQHSQMAHAEIIHPQTKPADSPANLSPTRARKSTAPIAKPPRQRRQSEESLSDRLSSLEDDSKSPRESNHLISTHNPRSNSLDYAIPRLDEDDLQISELSSFSDTESNISGDSVTIEPYGERRPVWMNDSLLSSTHSPKHYYPTQPHNKQIPDILNADQTSTNFISSFDQDRHHDLIEYTFGAEDIHHSSNNGTPNCFPVTHPYENPLVQYDFDEDSDQGFENCLTIDYSDNSNYFRNRNLCFESIKEEPEDCLSDSASTFEQVDAFSTNIFRSPTTSQSNTMISPPELRHSLSQGLTEAKSTKDTHIVQNRLQKERKTSFSTSERTSADGSEGIPQVHIGNGNPATHNLNPTYPLGSATIKRKPESTHPIFVEKDLTLHKKDLTLHKTDLASHKTALNSHKTDLTPHKTDLTPHKTDLTPHKTALTLHKKDLTLHKTDLASHKTDLNSHKTDLASHKTDLTSHKADLTSHKTNNLRAAPVTATKNPEHSSSLKTIPQTNFTPNAKDSTFDFHQRDKETNVQFSENLNSRYKIDKSENDVRDVLRTTTLLQYVDAKRNGSISTDKSAYF